MHKIHECLLCSLTFFIQCLRSSEFFFLKLLPPDHNEIRSSVINTYDILDVCPLSISPPQMWTLSQAILEHGDLNDWCFECAENLVKERLLVFIFTRSSQPSIGWAFECVVGVGVFVVSQCQQCLLVRFAPLGQCRGCLPQTCQLYVTEHVAKFELSLLNTGVWYKYDVNCTTPYNESCVTLNQHGFEIP